MTARPWTAGETAALDQVMAEEGATLNRVLGKIREQIAEDGEPQAVANTALALALIPPERIADLLLAALYRLTRDEREALT